MYTFLPLSLPWPLGPHTVITTSVHHTCKRLVCGATGSCVVWSLLSNCGRGKERKLEGKCTLYSLALRNTRSQNDYIRLTGAERLVGGLTTALVL